MTGSVSTVFLRGVLCTGGERAGLLLGIGPPLLVTAVSQIVLAAVAGEVPVMKDADPWAPWKSRAVGVPTWAYPSGVTPPAEVS